MTPLRKIGLWSLAILTGMVTVYLGILCLVSILVGFRHMQTTGFWVPILVGTVSLAVLLFLFLRITRHIMARMKQEDLVNM